MSSRRISNLPLTLAMANLAVAALLVLTSSAAAQEYAGEGAANFRMSAAGGSISSLEPDVNGATLTRDGGAAVLKSAEGKELARAEGAHGSTVTIRDNGNTMFTITYKTEGTEKQYRLNSPPDQLVYRVKIKEDKFNVYDSAAKRLYHGKQKPDGWSVNAEGGEKAVKLRGPKSLEEASYFAVPIATRYRLVLWGLGYLPK